MLFIYRSLPSNLSGFRNTETRLSITLNFRAFSYKNTNLYIRSRRWQHA